MRWLLIAFLTAAVVTPHGEILDPAGKKIGIIKPNPLGGFDIYAKDGATRLGHGRSAPDGTIELRDRAGNRGISIDTKGGKRK